MSKEATLSKFSFFKRPIQNAWPTKAVDLVKVYELIKGDYYKKQTLALRDLPQTEARPYKEKHFDYICPSGTFSYRDVKSLTQHSGLMVIDLDHLCGVAELKKALIEDKYFDAELLFTSPSGMGLKWIVSIDLEKGTHLEWFTAISNYIREAYRLEADPSGKDVARACFLCWDQDAYICPDYLIDSLTNSNSNNHENS